MLMVSVKYKLIYVSLFVVEKYLYLTGEFPILLLYFFMTIKNVSIKFMIVLVF